MFFLRFMQFAVGILALSMSTAILWGIVVSYFLLRLAILGVLG